MYRFNNDYNETCHPRVLNFIEKISTNQFPGYGTDEICEQASERIRKLCGSEQVAVHFLIGGTQTNLIMIGAALRSHQGVIAPRSGHIYVHETGAIEATGHKVLVLDSANGKIFAHQVERMISEHRSSDEAVHMVQPKMVYISNPTEWGTVYSKAEIQALSEVCKKWGLYLYVDGARLGYALTSPENDMTLSDYVQLCDAFYIGGTKIGAMFGEALVICNPLLREDFGYHIKQRGAMLAKGWLLGAQFYALLENELYFDVARKANTQAARIRETIKQLGFELVAESGTNQVFAVLPDSLLEELGKKFAYSVWEKSAEQETIVRFCTSWATQDQAVDALCDELVRLAGILMK